MTVSPPEADDTPQRLAILDREMMRRTIAALRDVRMPPGHADGRALRDLVRCDLQSISEDQRMLLKLMTWRWRRQVRGVPVPKTNPADPIVREMEKSSGR